MAAISVKYGASVTGNVTLSVKDGPSLGKYGASLGKDEASSGKNEASSGKDEVSSGKDEVSSSKDEVSSGKDGVSSSKDGASLGKNAVSLSKDEASLVKNRTFLTDFDAELSHWTAEKVKKTVLNSGNGGIYLKNTEKRLILAVPEPHCLGARLDTIPMLRVGKICAPAPVMGKTPNYGLIMLTTVGVSGGNLFICKKLASKPQLRVGTL